MIRLRVSRTWPAVFLLGTSLSCSEGTSPTAPGLEGGPNQFTGPVFEDTLIIVDTLIVQPFPLMQDNFSRTVAEGWGTAEVGGPWKVNALGPTFRVDGSRGVIDVSDIMARMAFGGGVESYGLNVEGIVSFSVDRAPDGLDRFHTVQVYARRTDRQNHYRYRVRIFGKGKMDVRLEKQAAGISTWLTGNLPLDITFTPGAKYWIRWEAVGTSPSTTVQMRVWPDGTVEPTTWHASAVTSEPLLDVSGTTGVRFQAPRSEQVTWPIQLFVDDLQYVPAASTEPVPECSYPCTPCCTPCFYDPCTPCFYDPCTPCFYDCSRLIMCLHEQQITVCRYPPESYDEKVTAAAGSEPGPRN
jgi:hypothetical protein